MILITVPLEIGFGQSNVNVQDLAHLQLHQQLQQVLQLPPPLLLLLQPPLLQQQPLQPQPQHKLTFGGLPANYNSLATNLFH